MLLMEEHQSAHSCVGRLVARAMARGVPEDVAHDARMAALKLVRRCNLDLRRQRDVRRVDTYFEAVVRRGALRRGSSPDVTTPYLIAADLADLRESGREAQGIWEELHRGWADKVPSDVLERFREQLCV